MPRVRPRSMFLQDPDGDNVSEMVVMVKHVSGRESVLSVVRNLEMLERPSDYA